MQELPQIRANNGENNRLKLNQRGENGCAKENRRGKYQLKHEKFFTIKNENS